MPLSQRARVRVRVRARVREGARARARQRVGASWRQALGRGLAWTKKFGTRRSKSRNCFYNQTPNTIFQLVGR